MAHAEFIDRDLIDEPVGKEGAQEAEEATADAEAREKRRTLRSQPPTAIILPSEDTATAFVVSAKLGCLESVV